MSLNLWKIMEPKNRHYATAVRIGAWSAPVDVDWRCEACKMSLQRRVQPAILEWMYNRKRPGDFLFTGPGNEFTAPEPILFKLLDRFRGFEPGPVEWFDPEKHWIYYPDEGDKETVMRTHKRHEPPPGPPYLEMWVEPSAHLDVERSRLEKYVDCSACGRKLYKLVKDGSTGIWTHHKWLFVPASEIQDVDIFRPIEFGVILCTDAVKEFIEKERFTNVECILYGEAY